MTPEAPPASRAGFYVIVGLVAFGLAVWFGSLVLIRTRRNRDDVRAGETRATLDALQRAIEQYHAERGVWPPGDGTGSAALARALEEKSRSGAPFLRFTGIDLFPDRDGQFWIPGGKLIHYKSPGDGGPFDLWSE